MAKHEIKNMGHAIYLCIQSLSQYLIKHGMAKHEIKNMGHHHLSLYTKLVTVLNKAWHGKA